MLYYATGGTETTCGDFKIHTFTADGPFNITNAGQPSGSNNSFIYGSCGGGGRWFMLLVAEVEGRWFREAKFLLILIQ